MPLSGIELPLSSLYYLNVITAIVTKPLVKLNRVAWTANETP